MVKVALKFKTPKNNQAIYKYDNVSFHGFNDKKICRSHEFQPVQKKSLRNN